MKFLQKISFSFFTITIVAFCFICCNKDKPSAPFDPACLSADKNIIHQNDTVIFTNCSVYDSATIEFSPKGQEFTPATTQFFFFDSNMTYKKVFKDTGSFSAIEKAFIPAGSTNDTAMVYIYVIP